MINNPIDSESFHVFLFNFWNGPVGKKILIFVSLQGAYGCQLRFVLVLWLNFIFVIYFFVLAQFGKIMLPVYHALCLPCMLHCLILFN